ncbi:MAG: class I SAM-dependent methyltransferase [Candidatus Latescibacteria bacterium]|nr:class I SAM-dependent methyltransferase [Candidatus Latescibacterota bacterium]
MDHQRNRKSRSVQFASRAVDYHRLQPVRIEMYEFYHDLALEFVPFGTWEEFRMLDLGCGTGTFVKRILDRYPKATCVAVDFSDEMIEIASRKVSGHSDRVEFLKRGIG